MTCSEIYTKSQRPGRERKHGETNPHRACPSLECSICHQLRLSENRRVNVKLSAFLFRCVVPRRARTHFTGAVTSLARFNNDVCDIQRAVFHVGCSARLRPAQFPCFSDVRSPLFPVSVFIIRAKQYLNRTGSEEDVTERLFGVSSHSLTPVDSHS